MWSCDHETLGKVTNIHVISWKIMWLKKALCLPNILMHNACRLPRHPCQPERRRCIGGWVWIITTLTSRTWRTTTLHMKVGGWSLIRTYSWALAVDLLTLTERASRIRDTILSPEDERHGFMTCALIVIWTSVTNPWQCSISVRNSFRTRGRQLNSTSTRGKDNS